MKFRSAIAVTLAVAGIGCGGGNTARDGGGPPTGPTNPTNPEPPVATTTITITSAGVSPKRITVPVGSRVTFINNDSRAHDMTSDPHPDHGDCPAINAVGFLQAGQTRLTGNLTQVRTCGFHDHNLPAVASLQGQIIVQ